MFLLLPLYLILYIFEFCVCRISNSLTYFSKNILHVNYKTKYKNLNKDSKCTQKQLQQHYKLRPQILRSTHKSAEPSPSKNPVCTNPMMAGARIETKPALTHYEKPNYSSRG